MIALAQAEPPGAVFVLSGTDIALRLLSVFLLIAINAFFVAAEFSIVSVRQSRINQLASAGDVQARTVQDLQRSIDRMLSTAQLGITLSSLALGWIGEKTVAVLLAATLNGTIVHMVSIPVAFLLVAYLQIVLGELCPKSLALLYPEQVARFLGPPSLAIARFFNPFIWVLNQSTRWLLRLFGIRSDGQIWSSRVTPEELQLIIQTSSASPELEEDERELLTNVLEFADVTVREVMVPRISIVAIPQDATLRDFLHQVNDAGYSRYPVIGESLDHVVGTIYFKDVVGALVDTFTTLDSSISNWLQPTRFVPEHLQLSELLHLMQESGLTLMMVADEFGGTAGLVTLEDVTEQIIGYAEESPNSTEESPIQILEDGTMLVQAQMNLDEVNELLELDLPTTEAYQTLGGFMIHQLQKIPAQGENLRYNNLDITVASVVGPRLHQIRIQRLPDPVHPTEPLEGEAIAHHDRNESN
ncbi:MULTISPECIES: hemolysin family protein [unclassified Leptolyngbya]|uniref:hemolysin family protein n=1 Tax=unclassified Leptolyngbya TaxID=2650499 RepID=UPI0016878B8C|nr:MULTISPECIES: hemolysin family protein [unclassified Leptolyngbya]MBD1909291.1 HlyC/CorC family transporter [Leptolyngbya sp. FACHB-8]MBD2153521.1 HlyC/CorC family transporter [Leptolyngbya sp. FACHB-16]